MGSPYQDVLSSEEKATMRTMQSDRHGPHRNSTISVNVAMIASRPVKRIFSFVQTVVFLLSILQEVVAHCAGLAKYPAHTTP